MTEKLFMVSVGKFKMYDQNQNLLAEGNTLSDTSLELTVNAVDVRGGQGAVLQYIYVNSPDMKLSLTETQFNMPLLHQVTGGTYTTGCDVWYEESVALTTGSGTVTETPVGFLGSSTKYGWVLDSDGSTTRVAFSGKNFTYGSSTETVCVRYYYNDAAAKSLVIPANIIPSITTLVIETQLASSTDQSNIVGSVIYEIPKFQIDPNITINSTMDGVASLPITGRCLAYDPGVAGCANASVYGYIKQIKTSSSWVDDTYALAVYPAELTLTHPATYQLVVKALHTDGTISEPPNADLTWASSVVGDATVSASGLVTTVSTGATLVTATITAAPTIDAVCSVTVS